jgi:hypothetical protein
MPSIAVQWPGNHGAHKAKMVLDPEYHTLDDTEHRGCSGQAIMVFSTPKPRLSTLLALSAKYMYQPSNTLSSTVNCATFHDLFAYQSGHRRIQGMKNDLSFPSWVHVTAGTILNTLPMSPALVRFNLHFWAQATFLFQTCAGRVCKHCNEHSVQRSGVQKERHIWGCGSSRRAAVLQSTQVIMISS